MTDVHEPTDDPGTGAGVDAELESGLELSPRTAASSPSRIGSKRRQRRVVVGGLLVLLLGGAAFLITQLTEATTYFYTADVAVAKKPSLGARTFRIEGTVVSDPIKTQSSDGERLLFHIASKGVNVPCDYTGGEPSSLFKAGEPVVLVGHFSGDTFAANQILVKHDAVYKEKHPDRVGPSGP